jgi:hypothetical protein
MRKDQMSRFYILLATVLFAAAVTIGVGYWARAVLPASVGFAALPVALIVALALRHWGRAS